MLVETVRFSSRAERWALLAIVVAALLARLAVIFESSSSDYHRHLVLDAATYNRIAIAGDPQGPYWQPPLYPWLLRLVYAVTGGAHPPAVRIIQAIGGAVTVLLVMLTARRFVSARWALGAGIATALYGPLIYFDNELLPASVAALLSTLLLYLLAQPQGANSAASTAPLGAWQLLAVGVIFGLLALLLPAFAPAAALITIWLGKRHGWGRALLVAVIAAAFVFPVTLRNLRHERDLVPISWNGGVNLWIGNNPDYPHSVGIRPGIFWTQLMEKPRCEGGASTAAQESAWFSREARRFARTQPLGFVRNLLRKAAASLSVFEIGRNREIYDARGESTLLALLLQRCGLPFGLLLPSAATALAALGRTRRIPWPVLGLVLGVLMSSVIFFPAARYRVPALPALILLSAIGLPLVRWRDTVAGGAALLVGLIPHGIPPIPASETLYEIASDLDVDGRTAAALPLYERALALSPASADIELSLGLALSKLGREEEGKQHLERAIELEPRASIAYQYLGFYHHRHQRWEQARALFEKAVAVDGCNQRVRAAFAMALIDQGYLNEARRQLDEAKRVYRYPDPKVSEADRRLTALLPNR